MIANKVKLVVWDLDDTFWTGTLLEGGIAPVPANVELVKELSRRGIVNSICSKNDPEKVRNVLSEMGIWDYFVFPHVAFSPKGHAIAEMLERAGLRAENTLFIDDNPSNLEEVKFFNPGIMVAHPSDVLDTMSSHPNCAGKADPELTRLNQYRFLQRKVEDRNATVLSNEDFLRQSNVRVAIDYDVEANFDRVVELINRTNQLNYTKKRLETPEAIQSFREDLKAFGHNSGCVWVSDNYGDYGLAGFFMMKVRSNTRKLIHFVFSCRTMNMGIEQYVYEMLGRPDLDIVAPVSYGIETHAAVDWINRDASGGHDSHAERSKLLLLGGCDLLQLASYCSTNRLEFVNSVREGITIRYDDPGFVLGDRAVMRENSDVLPTWSYEDALKFDEGIASSDLILLCMYGAVNGQYFEIGGSVQVRMVPASMRTLEREKSPKLQGMNELTLSTADRVELIMKSFKAVEASAKPGAHIFIIGYSTLNTNEKKAAKRLAFNAECRKYCETHPRCRYIDVDTLLPREALVDQRHFSPAGYFALARHILTAANMPGPALDMETLRTGSENAAPPRSGVTASSASPIDAAVA